MFIGRTEELGFLEHCYEEMTPQLVVLYGRSGVGKTATVKEFVKDKPHRYICLDEAPKEEQEKKLKTEWDGRWGAADSDSERTILIFDEFQHIIRNNPAFTLELLYELTKRGSFVILISSSVNWVENDMVRSLADVATRITSFIKMNEWGLMEMIARFPGYSLKDCIKVYSVTGGIPRYISMWDTKLDFKANVTKLLLNKEGLLYNEATSFLRSELRELPVYNTILYAMAMGLNKLYDINEYTGFGRAKISVYIKNLIGLDIVEKVFSFETDAKENTKKGVYRIKDYYILFYYRYIYKNKSAIEFADEDTDVYDLVIRDDVSSIWNECFKKVCREYIALLGSHGRLPINVTDSGSWYGKKGDIDYIGTDVNGDMLIAFFEWGDAPLGTDAVAKYNELIGEARIAPKYLYLFSKEGFTPELKNIVTDEVKLISLDEM